jgi:hypothetical protein
LKPRATSLAPVPKQETSEMKRVQIPAYTDRWMMGDRFGEIVKITWASKAKSAGLRAAILSEVRSTDAEIAHVKLDKSGKTVRVVLADCEAA